jgi:hypothetical protein
MAALFDRVGMTVTSVATSGTGAFTLGVAVTDATNGDYFTFAQAGVANAAVVNYLAQEGNNIEIGTGTYTSSGTTLSRSPKLTKSGGTAGTTTPLTFTTACKVYIVPAWSTNDLSVMNGASSTAMFAYGNYTDPSTYYRAGIDLATNSGFVFIGDSSIGSARTVAMGSNPYGNARAGLILQGITTGFYYGTGGGLGMTLTSLGLLAFGTGATSAFPALKRSSTNLQVRLADDSGFAGLTTGGLSVGYVAQTAAYTATATDSFISCDATSAAFTVTLPTAVGASGQMYTVKKIDSSGNAVTVGTTSSQTIDGASTYSLAARWNTVTVVSNGANWLIQSKV